MSRSQKKGWRSGSKIWHTPQWYSSKCKDEKLSGRIKGMLLDDLGDYFDNECNDEELIHLYNERYNTTDFIIENGNRISEIYIEDLKDIDKAQYLAITSGYGDTERQYLNVVDDIAKDLLNGGTTQLNKYIKSIRQEAEKPLKIKKKEQDRIIYKNTSGKDGVNEDEAIFTWNEIKGSQKDYSKEINYLTCITSLIISVEKRMDMITKENIKNSILKRKQLMNRLEKVSSVSKSDFDMGWVSRWLLLPINEMLNFNELFDERIKELAKENKDEENTDDAIKKMNDLINGRNSPSIDTEGFE